METFCGVNKINPVTNSSEGCWGRLMSGEVPYTPLV